MMFVRITKGTYPVDKEDEIARLVEAQFIPALKQLPGFRRYHGGVDRENSRHVSLTYWDEPPQSQNVQALREIFARFGVQYESAELYEIVVEG